MSSHTAFEKVVKHTLCWLWDQRITKIWKFNILCTDSICSFQIQWVTGKTEAPKGNAIQTILKVHVETTLADCLFPECNGTIWGCTLWLCCVGLHCTYCKAFLMFCSFHLHVLKNKNIKKPSTYQLRTKIQTHYNNCLSYRQNIFQKFLSKKF